MLVEVLAHPAEADRLFRPEQPVARAHLVRERRKIRQRRTANQFRFQVQHQRGLHFSAVKAVS
jgi:hypothetical protein